MQTVAAFTDTYLPTVNGVSYAVSQWRDRWRARGGRMDVVYPDADGYDPGPGEHPVPSLPFPFYEGFRIAAPWIPDDLEVADVVHSHTPFGLGLAGWHHARRLGVPFVVSFHTPTSEYTEYVAPTELVAQGLEGLSEGWERTFLGRADAVVAPSRATRRYLTDQAGVRVPVQVIPNGVDVDLFRPVDPGPFRRRHGVEVDGPLVGYTGRQGYEKCLDELVDAAAGMDVTVLLGGDGPARADLRRRADDAGADVRFLGFLDREELPAFYSALDVFAFPSPVETQGLVALEAASCGTPVVARDSGALADTVEDGVTGYHYPGGDVEAFRAVIHRALAERDELRRRCLKRRESWSVERSIDDLVDLYGRL